MKNITKEQITQVISDASKELNKNLLQDLTDSLEAFDKNTKVDINQPLSQIIAAMTLIQGKSNALLEKVLTDLLCN